MSHVFHVHTLTLFIDRAHTVTNLSSLTYSHPLHTNSRPGHDSFHGSSTIRLPSVNLLATPTTAIEIDIDVDIDIELASHRSTTISCFDPPFPRVVHNTTTLIHGAGETSWVWAVGFLVPCTFLMSRVVRRFPSRFDPRSRECNAWLDSTPL